MGQIFRPFNKLLWKTITSYPKYRRQTGNSHGGKAVIMAKPTSIQLIEIK